MSGLAPASFRIFLIVHVMSPQAEADDFTIEFTTLPTIVLIIILEVVGTIFFKNLSVCLTVRVVSEEKDFIDQVHLLTDRRFLTHKSTLSGGFNLRELRSVAVICNSVA